MKHLIISICFLLFTQITSANTCSSMVYGGEFPLTAEPHIILCKKEFVVGYSTAKKTPLWVAMRLDADRLKLPPAPGNTSFKPDPNIPREQQPSLSDYVGSGYDRGHLAPHEDVNHNIEAAAEASLLTNIIPQTPASNRGIWRIVEAMVRDEAIRVGHLFVIIGPIYEPNATSIGSGIMVPTHLFKIVIDPSTKTTTTYILPNGGVSSSELSSYILTRSVVKTLTNIEPIPAIILIDKK